MPDATGTLYFLLKTHDAAIYLAVLSPLVRSGGSGPKMVLWTKNGDIGQVECGDQFGPVNVMKSQFTTARRSMSKSNRTDCLGV
jgi:hypothetical protein